MNINDSSLYTQSNRLKVSQKYPQFESKHISSANDPQWMRRIWGAIINHGVVTGPGFQVGELFYEETLASVKTGKRGYISAKTASQITYNTTHSSMPLGGSNNDFTDTYRIVGETSGSTAIITNHDTGSHHYYDYYTSSVRLKVGLNSGDRAISHSTRYIPYFSGFEPNIEQTFDLTPRIGIDCYVIFGDDLNGVGLWLNGLTPYFIIRSNVSGTPQIRKFEQSRWISGHGIDFRYAQIQGVRFKWLGYGSVLISYVIDGNQYDVAKINNAGIVDSIFMRTPTLPVWYEIVNTTAQTESTELRIVCSQVSSEGGERLPGLEFSAVRTLKNARTNPATAGIHPNFAIRLKNAWPTGQPNRKIVEFIDMEFTAKTNDGTGILYHVHNPITMTATWQSVDDTSAVEYSTDISAITAEHMHQIQATDMLAGQAGKGGASSLDSTFINNHKYICQNYESKNSEILLFCVENAISAQPPSISGHVSYIETE